MKKLFLIALFYLSCVDQKKLPLTERENQILFDQYIVYRDFPSKYVIPRNIEIWLPKQYDNIESLPVLYMFDGQNIFHGKRGWIEGKYDHGWQVDETLDSLFSVGLVQPLMVVGIFNIGVRRYSEYMPAKPIAKIDSIIELTDNRFTKSLKNFGTTSDAFLKFLVEELKPFIDNKYKTQVGMESTYLAGSSMGGLISAYAICEYPEVFGGVACISTHWPALDGVFIEYIKRNLPDPYSHKFYFDYGNVGLDSAYEPYQVIVDSMMVLNGYEKNINWITKQFEGEDHNEDFWRKRFHFPMKFLFSTN